MSCSKVQLMEQISQYKYNTSAWIFRLGLVQVAAYDTESRKNTSKSASINKDLNEKRIFFYTFLLVGAKYECPYMNTPMTGVSSGFCDRTLAVKSRKKRTKIFFLYHNIFLKSYCEMSVRCPVCLDGDILIK